MPATSCAPHWQRSSAMPKRLAKMARSTTRCARRFGATIEAEARRMLRIVEDLMSLSRIEADRYRSPDEDVDMGEVARIAIEHSAALADRRGCRIEVADRGCDPASEGRLRPASPARRQSDRQRHSLWLQRKSSTIMVKVAAMASASSYPSRMAATASRPNISRGSPSDSTGSIRRAAANPAEPASALPSSNILSSGIAAKCGSIPPSGRDGSQRSPADRLNFPRSLSRNGNRTVTGTRRTRR